MVVPNLKCDECGGTLVVSRGELVCSECGLVHYRVFSKEILPIEEKYPPPKLTDEERKKEQWVRNQMLYHVWNRQVSTPVRNAVKRVLNYLDIPHDIYGPILIRIMKLKGLPDGSIIEKVAFAIYYELLDHGRRDISLMDIINSLVQVGYNTNYKRVSKFISRNQLYKMFKPLMKDFTKRFFWDLASKFVDVFRERYKIKIDVYKLHKCLMSFSNVVSIGARSHYYFVLYHVIRELITKPKNIKFTFKEFCKMMGVELRYNVFVIYRKRVLAKRNLSPSSS